MKKFTAAILALMLVVSPFVLPMKAAVPVVAATQLSDISGHWAEAVILKLVEKGYVNGYPDGTFLPNNPVTRAEFVKIVSGVLGITPASGGTSSFPDVAASDWFFGYVVAAVEKGFVSGYPDGTFKPNNPITRQEAAKVIVAAKAFDVTSIDVTKILENAKFTDSAEIGDWAKPYVAAAFDLGILKGYPDGSFGPAANITRAETAAIGYRVMPKTGIKVGLVTDVGGRGDKSFNDSALRGLEDWAAGWNLNSIPEDLKNMGITSLDVNPVIVESKANEDYVPNLTKMAKDEACDLVIAVGFMLTQAVQEVAVQFPDTKFMLIDGTITDENFAPLSPYPANVASYLFKEHEGSFLVGALAAQMTKLNVLGFVGGMEIGLIKKFETGYKAGIMTLNPTAKVLVGYTGNFTSADDGKKQAETQFGGGADIVYHAAGACGIGVIQAAKDKGDGFFAIGVDSDQDYMAPGRVLTSMIKHVDLAVYLSCKSVVDGTYVGGIIELGVKEGGVGYSPLTYTKDIIPAEALAKVESLKAMIASGALVVPDTLEKLATFVPPVITAGGIKVGLVTDVGGRGDKSFNDSALRGLEDWAAGLNLASIPDDLKNVGITGLSVTPVIVESKANEDYVPNLTKMAQEEKCDLVVAVGFMLTQAVQQVAAQFPDTKFMLIDGTITDETFAPLSPYPANVASYLFKEHEGSFLVGALAAQVTKANILGFVGGMEIGLIKKFETGYKAGIKTLNPTAKVLVGYTGNFTSADDGKKQAETQFGGGADIVYHAAGACGIGVIQAAKDAGEGFYAIGVDSDQDYMAPGRVLTSMIKHVDLAVWMACKSVVDGTYVGGIIELGVKEGGVGYSPLTYTKDIIPQTAIDKVELLRQMIIDGTLVVPDTLEKLPTFIPPTL